MNKIIKIVNIVFILILSLLVLTGCGGGGGNSNNTLKEPIEDEIGYGYVEGYIYKTSSGEYVFEDSKGTETPVEGGQIELNGTIYRTDSNGYFKSSKLKANKYYDINIIVEQESKPNFMWTKKITIYKNKVIDLAKIALEKNWNIILFVSDKSDPLEGTVEHFLDNVDNNVDLKYLNFFIIHGKYLDGIETNKIYRLTSSGKQEIKNYGSVDFGDPMFYRREIQNINENYPSEKTMVSILGHGNGWLYTGNPGTPQNWLINDRAHDSEGISSLDSYELHEMFNNIGFNIDIFNFSACHMGQIEVISDLPEEIKYAMASPSFGYTSDLGVHKQIMEDINNGIMNSKEIGIKYIDYYIDNLNSYAEKEYASVKALYNISELDSFVDEFQDFSNELNILFNDNPEKIVHFQNDILSTNQNVQSYYIDNREAESPSLVKEKDLVGILKYFKNNPGLYSENISQKAAYVYDLASDLIVYSQNSNGSEVNLDYSSVNKNQEKYTYNNSYGLSIYVKDRLEYKTTWFNQKTNWYKILEKTQI